jgi:integrase
MTGVIEQNFIKDIMPLRSRNNKIRGCYSLDELKGVFKNQWDDKKSYLLCCLIYSTGLRNSEIKNLKVKDIITKDTVNFLNIEKSKTVNGIRLVPLHPGIKEALEQWITENNLSGQDYLFIQNESQRFYGLTKKANEALGFFLKNNPGELQTKYITFYSGRHFYKTLLNSYKLGDIEELFMGHSVSRGVSERYNHKDKRGEQELLKAARRAIEIIDMCFFQC